MNLDRAEWATVLRLLDQALDLAGPAREPWLSALTLDPPHLKTALSRLLEDRRAIETADFLGSGARAGAGADTDTDSDSTALQAGSTLGPWRLLRTLGQGGMASVWLAERADAAHQRVVALKLPHTGLHLGANARAISERFARERAILSTLNHPHIAQVLDAGSHAGQPWLALEFVDGVPLTTHAQACALDTRARLHLFAPVLAAVQHAHAQLVIHRDIKPSNVLVATDGTVKLLDFGVAKLLAPDGAALETALTQLGGRAMTPQYASPEQVAGRPLGVASDVYSLGVLLYELLTGQLPYRLQRDTAAALEEAILGAQVQRPSAAVAMADKPAARALRGDVDTIVMKALHPEPAQRYASAAALAEDITRHLQALPIAARPASAGYRLRKLWQRQRLALAASAVVAAVLVAGVASTWWQGQRAQAEARRAESVQQFLVKLLQTTDPQQGQARDLPAGELLDLNAKRIEGEFKGQPDVQANLYRTLANIYVARGEPAKGQPLLERATALYAAEGRAGREAHVQTLVEMIDLQNEAGDQAATRQAVAQATRVADQYFGQPNRWTGVLLGNQAWVEMNEGRLAEARRLAEQALPLFKGSTAAEELRAINSLANIYLELGELAAARPLLEQVQRAHQTGMVGAALDRLTATYNLARVHLNLGEYAHAEAEMRRALPELEGVAGRSHDRTVMSRLLLALALAEQGQIGEALAEARVNLANIEARAAGAPAVETAVYRAHLGRLLRMAGRDDEALPIAEAALALQLGPLSRPNTVSEAVRRMLAEAQLGAGQHTQGIQTLDLARQNLLAMGERTSTKNRPEIELKLAFALRNTPRATEAPALAKSACDALASQRPASSLPVLRCQAVQAWVEAIAAPPDQRAAAAQGLLAARERLFAGGLDQRNALRAELLAAEAETMAADPARRAEAEALFLRADALYRSLIGTPLQRPLLVFH